MQESEYRGYVAGVIENMLVLLFPLSALFSVFGVPVVRVLFEGGSFDASSSLSTGAIFSAYMLGMVGFALLDMLAYSLAPCLFALILLVFHISKAGTWSVTAMLVVLMLNNYARVISCSLAPCVRTILS
jgi:hypothetical protein